jgi:hypothetical protein
VFHRCLVACEPISDLYVISVRIPVQQGPAGGRLAENVVDWRISWRIGAFRGSGLPTCVQPVCL